MHVRQVSSSIPTRGIQQNMVSILSLYVGSRTHYPGRLGRRLRSVLCSTSWLVGTSHCIVATLHPHASCVSLDYDCEKLYDTINRDSCDMKDQLGHNEGETKVPLPWFIPLEPL